MKPPPWSDDLLDLGDETDDLRLLQRLAKANREATAHLDRVKRERMVVAGRLRDAGYAMADIAKAADVSDSYLTRELLNAGHSRRYGQRTA